MSPFPALSVLKTILNLHLSIDLPEVAEIDVATLIDKFQSPVTKAGLKFVDADAACDAVLDAKIMLIQTVTGPTGAAMAYAYVITLCVLTNVGNHKSEMVIVWQDTHLGSAQAATLASSLYEAASSSAQSLATRLTK